jgi:hypothetical protein
MAPAIERRRRTAAALEPSDAELVRRRTAGAVTGLPLVLVRSEGVVPLAMAVVLYGRYGRSWWLFLALLWFAHIGMDRALGLELQYPDGSGCTHLRGR